MTEPLLLQKEYEWYLKETGLVKSPSGLRMKTIWSGCDVTYDIREDHLINPDGTAGPRLTELINKLTGGSVGAKGHPVKPDEYIRHGMHLFAEVQRHYLETRKEECVYEFVYDTVSPTSRTAALKVSEASRRKILFQLQSSSTLDQLRNRVKAIDPALLPALEQMIKSKEVVLP